MAKGYIIYVDGMKRPNRVHKTLVAAYAEMYRLAKINKGREVWLLKLQKRVLCPGNGKETISVGSHAPFNGMPSCLVSELIRAEELKAAALDRWPSNVKKTDALGEALVDVAKLKIKQPAPQTRRPSPASS